MAHRSRLSDQFKQDKHIALTTDDGRCATTTDDDFVIQHPNLAIIP